jgi:hypothetical protein
MNNESEIQQVEVSLEEAERIAEFGAALSRLENNRDFQAVILDGYFQLEAARLVMCTAEPHIKGEAREGLFAGIRGIAELRQYLLARRSAAEMAAKEIADYREELDELRGEV